MAVFVADRVATSEREPGRAFYELTANLVAFNACACARRAFPNMEPGEERTLLFMRTVRDRCFEGLLMLGVAQALPDDRRVQEWAAEHADPESDDGLSAVIPQACIDAVSAFVDENGDSEDRDELTEEALDGAYEIISLILRFADDDVMESLAQRLILARKVCSQVSSVVGLPPIRNASLDTSLSRTRYSAGPVRSRTAGLAEAAVRPKHRSS